jgi:hypothetical protein
MFAGDALNDDSDGVKRCAGCLWEIVNGQCINCGVAYTGGRLSDNDGESESEGEEEDDCSEEEDYLPTDEDFSDEIDSDLEDDGSTSDQSNRPDVIDIEAGDRLKNTPRKRHSEDQGGDTKKRRVIISDDDDSSNSDT